jgi:phosphate starvation-inducible protein PhoH and related proteins
VESPSCISLKSTDHLSLFGHNDQNIALIENDYQINLVVRDGQIQLKGPENSVKQVSKLLQHLIRRARKGPAIGKEELQSLIRQDQAANQFTVADAEACVLTTYRTSLRPRTDGQVHYLEAIAKNDIVFSIGPAGTGKTYLAVAHAVAALRQKEVSRIVLTRPAVEAGEHLGFLPGALEDKVDPYLRPLYDALQDLVEPERLRRFQEMKVIEIVPLAFMRGRTLNESFIILDEAQNTTPQQMKMFLTRLGTRSRAVITGDITQTDLPKDQPSGLIEIQKVLTKIDGLDFVYLTDKDVVRNPLVQKIIKAYDRFEQAEDPSPPS